MWVEVSVRGVSVRSVGGGECGVWVEVSVRCVRSVGRGECEGV